MKEMTKKRTTRRSTSKSRRSGRRTSSRPRQSLSLPKINLTQDQWLDILGYGMLLIAVLTLLSFLPANRGIITSKWVELLRRTFGWEAYLTPLFVGAVGLWLVLREFGDKLPRLTFLQSVGLLLGFLALSLTCHLIAAPLMFDGDVAATADAGHGGGYVGAALSRLFLRGLGRVGVVVLLITWWSIVIALIFGVTVRDGAQAFRRLVGKGQLGRPGSLPASPGAVIGRASASRGSPGAAPASSPSPPPSAPPAISRSPSPAAPPSHSLLIGDDQKWQLPALEEILEPGSENDIGVGILRQQSRVIEETLESLGAPVWVREMNPGPVVTQFGVEPRVITHVSGKCYNPACKKSFGFDIPESLPDVETAICPHCQSDDTEVLSVKETKIKVSRIKTLADDLALALQAKTLRIEAPIPGKKLIGIEVPNPEIALVSLRDVMESDQFRRLDAPLRLCLGQDVSGQPAVADLTMMPHLLIAGTTGSGKSVCINAVIAALLLQKTPDQLRFLMVDPKRVELTGYEGIPHLLSKVVVEMERVTSALQWISREMDGRYRRFAKMRATDIRDYNRRVAPEQGEKRLPYIVVVIDELADLMMMAPQETERSICRIAQMARATGIHLVIATQRPSVDVVTGLIKANFPARIAFNVASSVDSRVILDMPGAEQLLGQGDMLFLPPDVPMPLRLQGAFVSDEELRRLVHFWKEQGRPGAIPVEKTVQQPLWEEMREDEKVEFEDELLPDVIDLVLREERASISLLQRKLRIGYTRASRIMDILEEHQVVGPQPSGGRAREVFPAAARALLSPPGNGSSRQ
ncbi:MAG TPA: hypothetical protein ENN99_01975 [Chloroflexi bacterium]|nr:hypothetical protein [Chloroflexota bacterium]